MVSDSPRSSGSGRRANTDTPATDGGTGPGFDETALYTVVRDAVKDALLDVIGTLLLVGIAFVLFIAGVQAIFQASSPIGVGVAVLLAAFGAYLGAATLEIIPPVRRWF